MNAFNIKYKRIDSLIYEGKQGIDSNVLDNTGDTIEYHGVIPAGNISRYNISEQELNRIKHLSGLN
jgi:hypothetical protein